MASPKPSGNGSIAIGRSLLLSSQLSVTHCSRTSATRWQWLLCGKHVEYSVSTALQLAAAAAALVKGGDGVEGGVHRR